MVGKVCNFSVEGAAQLAANLAEMPKFFQRDALKKAAIRALTIVHVEAMNFSVRNVKRHSGRYEYSWRISTKLTKSQKRKARAAEEFNKNAVSVYVGSTDPKAHLLEFGHLAPDGSQVRAFPVLRPAWDMHKDVVFQTFVKELAKLLADGARKLANRAEKGKLNTKQQKDIFLGS